MQDFIDRSIEEIRNKVGNKQALCALSGGVDSSVAAVLVHRAIGNNLTCVFVDHGLLRKYEKEQPAPPVSPRSGPREGPPRGWSRRA